MLQVWGNIQTYEDPSRLLFDLSNHKNWFPLYFDKFDPPSSVQQDLQYSETDNASVMELQERYMRDRLRQGKKMYLTITLLSPCVILELNVLSEITS